MGYDLFQDYIPINQIANLTNRGSSFGLSRSTTRTLGQIKYELDIVLDNLYDLDREIRQMRRDYGYGA